MTGPTAWQQILTATVVTAQAITTTTLTAIATLTGVFSRSPGTPINLTGTATFAVQAATTATTLSIFRGTIAGTLLLSTPVTGGIAADITSGDGTIGFTDTPAGEVFNQTYTLAIQATAAGANWNVTFASLQAIF